MYLIFSLSVLLSFLNIGRTSACFNAVGKEELDNKLLKLGKTYNGTRSLFSVIVLIVISVACEAFLGFEFLTRFKVSFRETNFHLEKQTNFIILERISSQIYKIIPPPCEVLSRR